MGRTIINRMNDNDLWRGIADSHDMIQEMLSEFIDDSLSSIIANDTEKKQLMITISNNIPRDWPEEYVITVEDSGAGIKDLESAISFANTDGAESFLNRYGVGLKKVLATFDPHNMYWSIATRNKNQYLNEVYEVLTAPYISAGMNVEKINATEREWPVFFEGSGTIIKFPCSAAILATAGREYPRHTNSIIGLAQCIAEELSVVHRPYLQKGIFITVRIEDKKSIKTFHLKNIEPSWKIGSGYRFDSGEVDVNLGKGLVHIKYQLGEIDKHSETQRYFQRNFANAGLMIYENDRLIEGHIYKEIWGRVHPKNNGFLGVLELSADDAEALPPPMPTKNKLFYGDERVMKLYEWIHENWPNPQDIVKHRPQNKNERRRPSEKHLKDILERKLRIKLGEKAVIKRELQLFAGGDTKTPAVDIYTKTDNDGVTLYECKRDASHSLDPFQLIMYHIGAIHDGYRPNELILVAESHPKVVRDIVMHLQNSKDPQGEYFHIKLMTWKDFNIS